MAKKLPIILIFVAIIGGAVFYFWPKKSPDIEAAAMRTGLIGWWTMDLEDMSNNGATIYDKSGLSNHAVITGTTTSTGRVGQARNLNGSGDKIIKSSFVHGDALTYSAWTKIGNGGVASNAHLIDTQGAEGLDAGMGIFSNGGIISVYVDSGSAQQNINVAGPTWGTLNDGVWHHIVATKDANDYITVYVDGAMVYGPTATAVDDISQTGAIAIGSRSHGDTTFWNGGVDDVRIYNRVLSVQEVAQLYNSAKTTYANTAPREKSTSGRLIGWWKMDDADVSSLTVKDRSGLARNGTASIVPTSTPGKIGQARYFDKNLTIDVGAYSAELAGDFSIGGWGYLNALPGGGEVRTIAGKGNPYNVAGYGFMFYQHNNGLLMLDINNGSGSATAVTYSPGSIAGAWHHFFVTANRDGNATIYIDGTSVNSGDISGEQGSLGASSVLIGGYGLAYNPLYNWYGNLDDIRFYSYVLPAQEVANLYSAAKTNYAAAPPREGLVGWWTMDSAYSSSTRVLDKSGRGNHGTPYGFWSGRAPTSTAGKIGQGIAFDGINGKISAGDVLDFERNQPLTIAAWYKSSVINPAAVYPLVSKQGGFANLFKGYDLNIRGDVANDPLEFQMYNEWTNNGLCARFPRPNDTSWHHISVTYDGTSAISGVKGYVDGAPQTISSIADSLTTDGVVNNFNFEIGSWSGNSNVLFPGVIDDVRVYSRALSAQEITNLYESSRAIKL